MDTSGLAAFFIILGVVFLMGSCFTLNYALGVLADLKLGKDKVDV